MKPVLYSFRRCPFAIRARLAIQVSGVEVEMREVNLRHKPAEMLACSPKGTVPVLRLTDGAVIDESLDIMRWALAIHDPDGWIRNQAAWANDAATLIGENDGTFKQQLDRYKYPARVDANLPTQAYEDHREKAATFLRKLQSRLTSQPFLMCAHPTLADAAIFPFVRQFAAVDKPWFYHTFHGQLADWLDGWMDSANFLSVMCKTRGDRPEKF